MSDALLDRVWPTVASAYRMPDHSRNNASSSDLSFLGIDPASFLRFCKDTLCSIPVGDDMKGGLLLLAGTVGAAAMAMSFQVGGVPKALGAVSRIVGSGNRVIFDHPNDGGSYIEHKATGKVTPLRQ